MSHEAAPGAQGSALAGAGPREAEPRADASEFQELGQWGCGGSDGSGYGLCLSWGAEEGPTSGGRRLAQSVNSECKKGGNTALMLQKDLS